VEERAGEGSDGSREDHAGPLGEGLVLGVPGAARERHDEAVDGRAGQGALVHRRIGDLLARLFELEAGLDEHLARAVVAVDRQKQVVATLRPLVVGHHAVRRETLVADLSGPEFEGLDAGR
jgi:hypothetical protein